MNLSIVVTAGGCPARLRWLLDELAEQLAEEGAGEVVVASSGGADVGRVLEDHPLAARGQLRDVHAPPLSAALCNAGWRAATGGAIVFLVGESRPAPGWLAEARRVSAGARDAVLQGAVSVDPDEFDVLAHTPHARSPHVDPPDARGLAANILYPRDLLERLGGFDETLPTDAGFDTDLLARALEAGSRLVACPGMVAYAGVDARLLPARLSAIWCTEPPLFLFARHPGLRSRLTWGLFTSVTHAWLLLGALGVLASRRHPVLVALTLPWIAVSQAQARGDSSRGLVRRLSRLPSAALIDAAELAASVRASVRQRSLVL